LTWFLTQLFWYGSTGLEALLCFRLIATGTWRVYPRFTSFVGALACESVVLAFTLSRSNDLYASVWTITRTIALILEVLAVVEIFSRLSSSFPGIQSVGRKLFIGLFCGGLLLAVGTLPMDKRWSGWRLATNIISVVSRQTHLWLAAFLLLSLLFFAYYGAPVAANLRRHSWAMFTFLSASASTYLIATRVHNIRLSNIVLQTVTLCCLAVWMFAFRAGEDVRRKRVMSEREFREMGAAEALNERLMVLSERITLRSLLGLAPKARPSGD